MAYLRLRQICLATLALEDDVQAIRDILGVEVCHRDPNVGRYGLENAVFPIGGSFLELVAPTRPGTAVERFLAQRRTPGGYMIILDCSNAREYEEQARHCGIRVANVIDHGAYLGIQLHPRDTGAAILEFNHTVGGESLDGPYHPAGPDWRKAVRNDVSCRITAAQIQAPNAPELASLWAKLMKRPLRSSPGQSHTIVLDTGSITFTNRVEEDRAVFRGLEMTVADLGKVRKAAAAHGRLSTQGTVHLCGLEISLKETGGCSEFQTLSDSKEA